MRLAAISVLMILSGCDQLADAQMQKIEDKVATDAVNQYHIASQSGSPMDKCVQAGMVAAAYLQAEDQPNYATWKATEKSDCTVAGVPEM